MKYRKYWDKIYHDDKSMEKHIVAFWEPSYLEDKKILQIEWCRLKLLFNCGLPANKIKLYIIDFFQSSSRLLNVF